MDYQYQKGDETPGKVWLVSVIVGREIHRDAALELSELATSCGFQVAGLTEAKRDRPDPKTFLGSGKTEEIKNEAMAHEAKALILMSLYLPRSSAISKKPSDWKYLTVPI